MQIQMPVSTTGIFLFNNGRFNSSHHVDFAEPPSSQKHDLIYHNYALGMSKISHC